MSFDRNAISDILIEFLEVATHMILHTKNIYPESIFVRRRKYGIPIDVSIHPQLNEYIGECLRAAQFLAKQNQLRKYVICFFSANHRPLEKFVIDIIKLNNSISSDSYLVREEQGLRSFCVRLAASSGYLKPLPDASTFTIQLYTPETSSIELGQTPQFQNFPWAEVNSTMIELDNPKVIPIHTMDTDYLLMNIFVSSDNV